MDFKNLKLKDFLMLMLVLILASTVVTYGPRGLVDLIFGAEGAAAYDGLTTGQLSLAFTGIVMFLARSWLHYAIAASIPKFIALVPARYSLLGTEVPLRVIFYFPYEIFFNVSLFFDKLVSAMIPGKHHQLWVTVSYRLGAWKAEGNPVATFICVTFLHPFDNGHCKRAFEFNEGGDDLFEWVRVIELADNT